jgi:hypothetical protein
MLNVYNLDIIKRNRGHLSSPKFFAADSAGDGHMIAGSDELEHIRLLEMSADEIVRHQKDAWDRARQDEEAAIVPPLRLSL